jgi:hypothetical protein
VYKSLTPEQQELLKKNRATGRCFGPGPGSGKGMARAEAPGWATAWAALGKLSAKPSSRHTPP